MVDKKADETQTLVSCIRAWHVFAHLKHDSLTVFLQHCKDTQSKYFVITDVKNPYLSFQKCPGFIHMTQKCTLAKQTISNLNSPQFAFPLPQHLTLFSFWKREVVGGEQSCQTPSPLWFFPVRCWDSLESLLCSRGDRLRPLSAALKGPWGGHYLDARLAEAYG